MLDIGNLFRVNILINLPISFDLKVQKIYKVSRMYQDLHIQDIFVLWGHPYNNQSFHWGKPKATLTLFLLSAFQSLTFLSLSENYAGMSLPRNKRNIAKFLTLALYSTIAVLSFIANMVFHVWL